MPLVTAHELLNDARAQRFAVGAFNANNLEYVQGIITGAESERAPVFIQASPGAIRYAGVDNIVALVGAAASTSDVPVVLHLDHGDDIDLVAYCIRRGFTSVMFDGSRLSIDDNIRLTAAVVRMAHRSGVSAEGELGIVPGSAESMTAEEVRKLMTDPEQAKMFAAETRVDSLAVAVGSIHQLRDHRSSLDIQRITDIAQQTAIPLVLHGASGVSENDVVAAVAAGVCKVNVATALNEAFTGALRGTIKSLSGEIDPRRLLSPARTAVKEVVAHKIRLLGSSGRAITHSRAAEGGSGS